MKTETFELENGLQVVLTDTQTFPSFTALLLVGAGSRYENKQNNGVAHFFEHMAFKGSQKYPTALEITTLLDSLGSQQNAYTTKDHTGYWIKGPSKHIGTIIEVLTEMVLNPLLKAEEIEREKGVIVEEINMYEDTPQYKVWNLFENTLFPNSSLGYDVIGQKQTVSKFKRQTFLSYMDLLYKPNNAVLAIAGGIDKDKILKIKYKIKELFGSWEKQKTIKAKKYDKEQKKNRQLIHQKKTEQAHFVLGYPGLSRHDKQRYVFYVLAALLGGSMSSRLFYELRERRGLCYYIQSGTELFEETGYLYSRAGVSNQPDKIKEAISLILQEQDKIAQGDFSNKELKKTKEMLKGRLLLSWESSDSLASLYGKRLLFKQNLLEPNQVLNKIDQVKQAEVIKLAQSIFRTNKLNLAVIGPFAKLKLDSILK